MPWLILKKNTAELLTAGSAFEHGWISVRTADLKGLTADLVQSPPTLKHSESRGKVLEQNSERL